MTVEIRTEEELEKFQAATDISFAGVLQPQADAETFKTPFQESPKSHT